MSPATSSQTAAASQPSKRPSQTHLSTQTSCPSPSNYSTLTRGPWNGTASNTTSSTRTSTPRLTPVTPPTLNNSGNRTWTSSTSSSEVVGRIRSRLRRPHQVLPAHRPLATMLTTLRPTIKKYIVLPITKLLGNIDNFLFSGGKTYTFEFLLVKVSFCH